MMRSGEWPLQVVFALLHTSQKALVGGYERLIREGMLSDGLFDGLDMSQPIGARLSTADRMLLAKANKVDAVLCGSLMAAGKDNAINAVGVALRLIDTSSGRILWAGSANARRVWRKDRFDDLSQTIATDLVAGLAKVKSGAQTDSWANQPEPQDGPGWVNRGMVALELKLSIGLEVAMAYGDQINKHPWESDGRRQFTLGVGIRNVHKIVGRFGFYYTLSDGTIYRPANSGVFFQPKIGALISLHKRVAINLNTFWTIPIAKAEGILEQPFSVGLNFQL